MERSQSGVTCQDLGAAKARIYVMNALIEAVHAMSTQYEMKTIIRLEEFDQEKMTASRELTGFGQMKKRPYGPQLTKEEDDIRVVSTCIQKTDGTLKLNSYENNHSRKSAQY